MGSGGKNKKNLVSFGFTAGRQGRGFNSTTAELIARNSDFRKEFVRKNCASVVTAPVVLGSLHRPGRRRSDSPPRQTARRSRFGSLMRIVSGAILVYNFTAKSVQPANQRGPSS